MTRPQEVPETVIVGAGIAGLSAAVFLARAGLEPLVFDAGDPTIYAVKEVREFPGFDGYSPQKVLGTVRDEAERYGAKIVPDRVISITLVADALFEIVSESTRVTAKSVVLATGVSHDLPDVTGVREPWGQDLRVCPCFDGQEVKGQRFVVFGTAKERVAHMGCWVSMWSDDVTVVSGQVFTDEERERFDLLGIRTVADEVAKLKHEQDQLVAVETTSGERIACDATWISNYQKPTSVLAWGLCEVDEQGYPVTDPAGATSCPGLFAVGCASSPWDHLAQAAASGTTVGPVVTSYLLDRKVKERRIRSTA